MEAEERIAAQFNNYTWEQYQALPGADWWVDELTGGDSKSSVVMFYRFKTMMQALEYQEMEPKTPASKGKGGR